MPKSKIADLISHKADNDYLQNIAVNIAHEMFVKNLSIRDLAGKTSIAEATLRLRLQDPGTLKANEIVKISNAMKVSPYKLTGSKLKYEEVETCVS